MPSNNSSSRRKSTDSPTPKNQRRTHATKVKPSDAVVSADDKYAATKWGGERTVDLEVPSGQLCLARRPGLNGLLKAGVLHDIDPLLPLVDDHVARVEGRQKTEEEMERDQNKQLMEIFKDPSKFETIEHMIDRVVCYVVIKPEIEMSPNDITTRKPDVIYADMVDLMDKMFILDWCLGGAADVASFREKFSETLGNLVDVQESEAGS